MEGCRLFGGSAAALGVLYITLQMTFLCLAHTTSVLVPFTAMPSDRD